MQGPGKPHAPANGSADKVRVLVRGAARRNACSDLPRVSRRQLLRGFFQEMTPRKLDTAVTPLADLSPVRSPRDTSRAIAPVPLRGYWDSSSHF